LNSSSTRADPVDEECRWFAMLAVEAMSKDQRIAALDGFWFRLPSDRN
jgi:hypothetical protein